MDSGPICNEEILNVGLDLALEWGKDWLEPIQQRLAKKYPRLTEEELDGYNAVCRQAMDFSHSSVGDLADTRGLDVPYEEFVKLIRARLPWISDKNLSRAYSQGMYYIRK
jgi:hypothetical protein